MAYFCELYLFNGGARTQFIRQGLRQNDPFVFPRLNYFNQDDTRLFNACMLEWCASMDAAPACPAELQQEPLQEINTQAGEGKADWGARQPVRGPVLARRRKGGGHAHCDALHAHRRAHARVRARSDARAGAQRAARSCAGAI